MPLLLPDRSQIDPGSVWLRLDTDVDNPELFLIHRDTGQPVNDTLPFGCGKLPHPFRARICHQHKCWRFTVPSDMSVEEVFSTARAFGFRTDPDDVVAHGDPGHTPGTATRQKVFSARRREGRPGEHPVTVIMAAVAKVDANGFVSFDCLRPEEIPSHPPLHADCLDEIFLTDALPAEVEAAWKAQGFVERKDVVGCFRPDELYVCVQSHDENLHAIFMTRGDFWMDDDLRDHSLAVMPSILGENLCENEWALRRGVSEERAMADLVAAGFVSMPKEMRERFV